MIRRLLKRLMVAINGAPVCRACEIYDCECIGWCGKSDAERISIYMEGRAES